MVGCRELIGQPPKTVVGNRLGVATAIGPGHCWLFYCSSIVHALAGSHLPGLAGSVAIVPAPHTLLDCSQIRAVCCTPPCVKLSGRISTIHEEAQGLGLLGKCIVGGSPHCEGIIC